MTLKSILLHSPIKYSTPFKTSIFTSIWLTFFYIIFTFINYLKCTLKNSLSLLSHSLLTFTTLTFHLIHWILLITFTLFSSCSHSFFSFHSYISLHLTSQINHSTLHTISKLQPMIFSFFSFYHLTCSFYLPIWLIYLLHLYPTNSTWKSLTSKSLDIIKLFSSLDRFFNFSFFTNLQFHQSTPELFLIILIWS